MPEHTPAPTPSRSIYGFVLFLASNTLFLIYVMWSLLPDSWLHAINIYYYPQKQWAVAIPILLLVGLSLFAFLVYPGLNLMLTPNIDDCSTITSVRARKVQSKIETEEGSSCDCKNLDACFKTDNQYSHPASEISVPPAIDLDIRDVCRMLYVK